MSIYGNNFKRNNSLSSSKGSKVIWERKGAASSVPVFEQDSKYYIATSDLENYMEAGMLTDVDEAVSNIAESNCIDKYDIVVAFDECSFLLEEALEESSQIVYEKSVEDDAVSLSQIMKWYSKFITTSKSKAENKKEIEERIKVLKECVKSMQAALGSGNHGERIKYSLKSLIPLNWIYRLIKRQDSYAGLGWLADLLLPGVSLVIRGVSWESMIGENIKKTEEAIAYLEGKLKEFK